MENGIIERYSINFPILRLREYFVYMELSSSLSFHEKSFIIDRFILDTKMIYSFKQNENILYFSYFLPLHTHNDFIDVLREFYLSGKIGLHFIGSLCNKQNLIQKNFSEPDLSRTDLKVLDYLNSGDNSRSIRAIGNKNDSPQFDNVFNSDFHSVIMERVKFLKNINILTEENGQYKKKSILSSAILVLRIRKKSDYRVRRLQKMDAVIDFREFSSLLPSKSGCIFKIKFLLRKHEIIKYKEWLSINFTSQEIIIFAGESAFSTMKTMKFTELYDLRRKRWKRVEFKLKIEPKTEKKWKINRYAPPFREPPFTIHKKADYLPYSNL